MSGSSTNNENLAPIHKAALLPSLKHVDDAQGSKDVAQVLGVLKDMHISNSSNQLADNSKVEREADVSHKDGRGTSHRGGNEDLLRYEHDAINVYFFKNCPVALELQELRLNVGLIT